MQKQFSKVPENEPVISLTHIYDAPRDIVWEAFTKPEHLKHWWGPNGFTIENTSSEMGEGGHWEFIMIGPDGKRWPNYHKYTAFVPMDLISYDQGKDDPAFSSTITFTDLDNKTRVNMTMTLPSLEARSEVLGFDADKLGLQTLANAETYILAGKVGQ